MINGLFRLTVGNHEIELGHGYGDPARLARGHDLRHARLARRFSITELSMREGVSQSVLICLEEETRVLAFSSMGTQTMSLDLSTLKNPATVPIKVSCLSPATGCAR
jgi:hypothetical protein